MARNRCRRRPGPLAPNPDCRIVAGGIVALSLLLAPLLAMPAAAAPARIVSVNPCVDAILVEVADARQIAGISHYSQDPRATSMALATAARFKATSGTAEEIVALAPDLVLSGSHVAPATVAALRRQGVPLVEIGIAETIAQSRAQIRTIARATGHPERGEALVARIDAAVAAAAFPGTPVAALIWAGGGLVPGTATLADDLLHTSGFRNLSADYGLQKWDVLPLERLVARPPRLLLTTSDSPRDDRMLGHPVLRPLAGRIALRAFPERLLNCGGPTIIAALGRLAAVRKSL
jgi:iron complex transport system substrate-binding protein